jgi:hypothetical protein
MSAATEELQSHTGKSSGTTIADLSTLGEKGVWPQLRRSNGKYILPPFARDFA